MEASEKRGSVVFQARFSGHVILFIVSGLAWYMLGMSFSQEELGMPLVCTYMYRRS